METKEAIKFCETKKRIICGRATQCPEAKGFNEVIDLLKRLDKLQQKYFPKKKINPK